MNNDSCKVSRSSISVRVSPCDSKVYKIQLVNCGSGLLCHGVIVINFAGELSDLAHCEIQYVITRLCLQKCRRKFVPF